MPSVCELKPVVSRSTTTGRKPRKRLPIVGSGSILAKASAKEENSFFNHKKEVKHLDTNYRSYSEVIEFNNDFFKLISAEFTNEDYKDLYENLYGKKED